MVKYLFGISFLLILFGNPSYSQKVILGGNNAANVKVSSSDHWKPLFWKDSASSRNTLNGSGLNYDLFDASRFLCQATLGANLQEIQRTSLMSKDAWIEEQFKINPRYMSVELDKVYKEVLDWYYLNGGDSTNQPGLYWNQFQYAWWNLNMTNQDKLRQRVAFALSELFVISINADIGSYALGLANYYDVLTRNSFGNFRNLLREVTLHPAMGSYLSHLNNPKSNEEENIHPDENYAREIMQLFSIGLYELNIDGTYKLDSLGNQIPTYDQNDIKEFAKIFTGLSFSAIMPNRWIDTAQFGVDIYLGDLTKPMRMFDEYHEPGSKYLLNGFVTPARQNGMADIEMAIDNLFNHPNVGPFICKQLIQRLIKSNPTPAYVARVSRIFNNDGKNVRGNMAAVIKAILLDPEARDCDWLSDPKNGQLREPILRYSQFASANELEQYYGRFWNTGYEFLDNAGQLPFASPTVFNFFSPFYKPNGPIGDQNLVGPEFQIHNSRTSIGFINQVNNWALYSYVFYSWERDDPYTTLVTTELEALARDPEALVNRLDVLFTHGNLSDRTRSIIKNSMTTLTRGDYREDRVRLALYLIMISPDYAIFK